MPENLIIVQGDGRVLTPEEESLLAERERYLSDVVDASDRAIAAVQTIRRINP